MNPSPDALADFAFCHAPGIGPMTYSKLVTYFGSSSNAYAASEDDLAKILQGKQSIKKLLTFRNIFKADKTYFDMYKKDIHFINHKALEKIFMNCSMTDKPIGLFTKGDISLLGKSSIRIAIIGSRKPTQYGVNQTIKLVHHLSQYKCFVLSGLAIGIDTIAHTSALKYKLKTISILGSGFNHVHPKSNLGLYRAMDIAGGLHITEFPPDVSPSAGTFRIRNRILAALADAVVVIEGNKTSGTRITAGYAIEQNKDVFALPGPITSPLSHTPNSLIQSGAHLLDTPSYLTSFYSMPQRYKPRIQKNMDLSSFSSEELSMLELDGRIQRNPDGTYTMLQ